MHKEGLEILPELIQLLCIEKPVLLGHSDGASISIICAGGSDTEISGLLLMAPHLFVEQKAIDAIQSARDIWITNDTNFRNKLSRFHNDADSAFFGWNDIWLHEDFRQWNIEEYLSGIKVPIMAIQGYDDEYGSMKQIEVIKQAIPDTELLKLTNCRHSPHLDRTEDVINATCGFIKRLL